MRGLKNNQFLEICLNVFFQWQKCKYPAQHNILRGRSKIMNFSPMRIGSLLNGHGEFFALLYCRRSVAARESRAIGQKGGIEMGLFYIAHTLRSIASAYPGFLVFQAVIASLQLFDIFV